MSGVCAQSPGFLPQDYSDSRVVLLARDAYWLFAYWEISPQKKESFIKDFGLELWEKSEPVMKIINVTRNTSFTVKINDSTNNWYIKVDAPNCLYTAEIGRQVSDSFFINLAASNYVSTPDDSVSSNTTAYFIDYNDLKHGNFDFEQVTLYHLTTGQKDINGLSSPELFGITSGEVISGVSSAQLQGMNLPQYLGISSGAFYMDNMNKL